MIEKNYRLGMGVGYSPDTRHQYQRHPTSPGYSPDTRIYTRRLFNKFYDFYKLKSQINLLLAVI